MCVWKPFEGGGVVYSCASTFCHLGYVHFANYVNSFCRGQNDVFIILVWRFGGWVIGILCPSMSFGFPSQMGGDDFACVRCCAPFSPHIFVGMNELYIRWLRNHQNNSVSTLPVLVQNDFKKRLPGSSLKKNIMTQMGRHHDLIGQR